MVSFAIRLEVAITSRSRSNVADGAKWRLKPCKDCFDSTQNRKYAQKGTHIDAVPTMYGFAKGSAWAYTNNGVSGD